MQRLFTTFANSWPGFGLLIQRLVIGVCLLHSALVSVGARLSGVGARLSGGLIILEISAAVLGLFVLAGLWTPAVGVLVVAVEFGIILMGGNDIWMSLMIAVFACTLAMIGPGAWSVDARLFGRKHIGS